MNKCVRRPTLSWCRLITTVRVSRTPCQLKTKQLNSDVFFLNGEEFTSKGTNKEDKSSPKALHVVSKERARKKCGSFSSFCPSRVAWMDVRAWRFIPWGKYSETCAFLFCCEIVYFICLIHQLRISVLQSLCWNSSKHVCSLCYIFFFFFFFFVFFFCACVQLCSCPHLYFHDAVSNS